MLYVVATSALLMRSSPGRVGIDTKQYLYLDPSRLLAAAPTMWDPGTAFGTVPHQRVGFMWPMGPFFWVGEQVGLPDWVTQRLWLAGLFVAAGLGVRAAARALGVDRTGAWTAALVFAWSPYVLGYIHRTSVLLLPWAGIGWLVRFAIMSVRRGGWRGPAAFALVALTVGGANATAFLLIGLAPALWMAMAAADRSIGWRTAGKAALRLGVLTAGTSLWWVVALMVQGRYSLNVLRYSETLDAVALSTSAVEALRGLGYWLFYGRDRLEAWIEPASAYQVSVRLIALTFITPFLGAVGLVATRWRYRTYAALLVLVGLTVATGAYPWGAPSALGALFKAAATGSDLGLALRSSSRAVPLITLGLALGLGALITSIGRHVRPVALGGAVIVCAVAFAALPPLWKGELVAHNLSRREELPAAWREAAQWLDSRPHDTRILAIPGVDLTFHRWGAVWEPILPGLTDRPFAARELIPYGGAGAVDLLMALDRRMQEGTIAPAAIAPIARLLGAGDVVLRSDLQYERYRTPRPEVLWGTLEDHHPGLADPVEFGPATPNHAGPALPLLDEIELRIPDDAEAPPAVAAFSVEAARPLIHTAPLGGALVVSGSGDGLVDAAAAGLIERPGLVVYSASYVNRPDELARLLASGADVLVTDSNRRRALRWRTLRDNAGYTETAGEQPMTEDLSDARLDLFPAATDAARSVTVTTGARARATAYGNPVSYTPDVRAQLALDGDRTTAWRVGTFGDPRGERLLIELEAATSAGSILVRQDHRPGGNAITRIELRVDGRAAGLITLDERSWTGEGQKISLPSGAASKISLEIDEVLHPPGDDGLDPSVGIAEVTVPGVTATEAVRLPVDVLEALGPSLDQRLVLSMARLRSDPAEVVRGDDEASLQRIVKIPASRTFSLAATARLAADASDSTLATALGLEGPAITASDSLGGDLRSRPWSAHDGDPTTRWRPGFGDQVGRWIEIDLGAETTVDHLDLELIADGRHSVPTRITIEVDGVRRTVELPAVEDTLADGATVAVPIGFEALTGRRLRITIEEVRERRTRDWYSLADITTPVGIAELGVPGMPLTHLPAQLPSTCRAELVKIAGRPVEVRLDGDVSAALDRQAIALRPCEKTGEITLDAGSHRIAAAPGTGTGIDVDGLVMASDAGGTAAADPLAPLGQSFGTEARDIVVHGSSTTEHDATVEAGSEPIMLVLGQTLNDGWHASANGHDLGPATLVDGYANGWVLPASPDPVEVTFTWTPQRYVWLGHAASALAVLVCLAMLVVSDRHRPATGSPSGTPDRSPIFAMPWARAPDLSAAAAGAVAAGAGGVGLLVSTPAVALVVAVMTGTSALIPWGRVAMVAAGLLSVGAGAGYVILSQRQHHWAADFDWPTHFETAHHLIWCGVLLVVAEVAVDALRRCRATSAPPTRVAADDG